MIISHKHKFIFIKTQKTAGTSIEIALSKYCGPNDIITPISEKDELVRRELGYLAPQNYRLPYSRYLKSDFLNLLRTGQRLRFYNHCSAKFIKNHISQDVWDSYYKFCFEREPVSKMISWYNWLNRDGKWESFSEFLASPQAFRVSGIDLYTIDSRIAVDDVYKFENLDKAMAEIAERLGLPEVPELVRTKSSKSNKKSANNVIQLTPEEIALVSKVYAREIAYFDYKTGLSA